MGGLASGEARPAPEGVQQRTEAVPQSFEPRPTRAARSNLNPTGAGTPDEGTGNEAAAEGDAAETSGSLDEGDPLGTPSLGGSAYAPGGTSVLLSGGSHLAPPHEVHVLNLGHENDGGDRDPQSTVRIIRGMQQRYLSTQFQAP